VELGVILGFEDGTFPASTELRRDEIASFLARVLDALIAPYPVYPALDGWVGSAVIGDRFWPVLLSALEVDEAAFDGLDLARNVAPGAATGRFVVRSTTAPAAG